MLSHKKENFKITERYATEQHNAVTKQLEQLQSKLEQETFTLQTNYQDIANQVADLASSLQNRMALIDDTQQVIRTLQNTVSSY